MRIANIKELEEYEASFTDMQALERAETEIAEVCKSVGDRFRMTIPVDPERDTDLIIGLALSRLRRLLEGSE